MYHVSFFFRERIALDVASDLYGSR